MRSHEHSSGFLDHAERPVEHFVGMGCHVARANEASAGRRGWWDHGVHEHPSSYKVFHIMNVRSISPMTSGMIGVSATPCRSPSV